MGATKSATKRKPQKLKNGQETAPGSRFSPSSKGKENLSSAYVEDLDAYYVEEKSVALATEMLPDDLCREWNWQ